jgi:hypothetical protein
MANTYTWKINQLDSKIHEGGLDNVIYIIHWSYLATDDSLEPITVSVSGALGVKYNEGDPFIPYEDLTKEDVVSWLESSEGINVDAMKENLDNQIELKKNPVDEYLYPNWD